MTRCGEKRTVKLTSDSEIEVVCSRSGGHPYYESVMLHSHYYSGTVDEVFITVTWRDEDGSGSSNSA